MSEGSRVVRYHGDALDVILTLPDDFVDAVVTDPPYELGFMGRAWDASGIAYNVELWKQCFRVLKPGGHLLAFGGTRTSHRLAVAVEDAGFEIRDSIVWIYGSGFPKSLDVSKAIDRQRNDQPDWQRVGAWLRAVRESREMSAKAVCAAIGAHGEVNHGGAVSNWEKGFGFPTWEQWLELQRVLEFGDEMNAEVWRLNGRKGTPGEAWAEREVIGQGQRVRRESTVQIAGLSDGAFDLTAPATDDAKRWAGWGTALKPAHEPIVVARKPLVGTVAANVLAHGTGALNIDACRVGDEIRLNLAAGSKPGGAALMMSQIGMPQGVAVREAVGRWPANVVLTHAGGDVDGDLCADGCVPGCPVRELDEQSGARGADSGGASRFFLVFRYQAKAPTRERVKIDGVAHPTVKPLDLMRWLVRLVTQPDGVVLEPFAGSGTTVEACVLEGMRCLAIEREESYLPLIAQRMERAGLVAW